MVTKEISIEFIKENILNVFLYSIATVVGLYYNLAADHLGFSDSNGLIYSVVHAVVLLLIVASFIWIGIIRNAILPFAAIIILAVSVWI